MADVRGNEVLPAELACSRLQQDLEVRGGALLAAVRVDGRRPTSRMPGGRGGHGRHLVFSLKFS
jgi:hypothetical protein